MSRLFFIIVITSILLPLTAKAQSSDYLILGEEGGYKNHLSKNSYFRYGWRKNDSIAFEGGISWFHEDVFNELKGALGVNARFVYTFDMLSIIPSFYLGATAGYDFPSKNSMMMFEYGLAADYLYSRKFRFGLSFGGYTLSVAQDEGDAKINSGWLLGIRLIWTLGEEW